MKKVLLSFFALLISVLFPISVFAEGEAKEKINVYMFYGEGCGYCAAAKEFFAGIDEEYKEYYSLVTYEVWHDKNNSALMQGVAEYLNEDVNGVPYIVIGDTTFAGYASEYDQDILDAIKESYNNEDYVDVVSKVKDGGVSSKKNYDTYIVIGIFAAIIGGFGALIYFSRK